MSLLRRFVREEEGQDAIEYALFLAYTSVVTVATVGPLRNGFTKFCLDIGGMVLAAEARIGVLKQLADALS